MLANTKHSKRRLYLALRHFLDTPIVMTMTTDNFQLHCQAWGNPKKPPIVFLHGFLGTGNDWRTVAEALSSEFYCVAPDIPGHGKTLALTPQTLPKTPEQHVYTPASTSSYTMESVAPIIIHLINTLEQQQFKPLLCGYSMGGRLALFLALRFAKYFRGACILSGTAGLRTEEERQARQNHDEQLAQRLETEPLSAFLEFWYNQALFAPFKHHAAFHGILAERTHLSPQEAARSLRGMGTGAQPNCWEELAQNTIPIEFVAGEKDSKFAVIARELHGCTPYSQHHIIPNVGHVLHQEAPEEVICVLRELNIRKR